MKTNLHQFIIIQCLGIKILVKIRKYPNHGIAT